MINVNLQLSPEHIAACDRISKAIGARTRSEVLRRSISVMDRLSGHAGRVLLEDEAGELAELVFESVAS